MCNSKTPDEQIRELNARIKEIRLNMYGDVLKLLEEQHEVALEDIDQIQSGIIVDLLLDGFPALLEVAHAALDTLSAAADPSPLEFLNSIDQLEDALSSLDYAVADSDEPEHGM